MPMTWSKNQSINKNILPIVTLIYPLNLQKIMKEQYLSLTFVMEQNIFFMIFYQRKRKGGGMAPMENSAIHLILPLIKTVF